MLGMPQHSSEVRNTQALLCMKDAGATLFLNLAQVEPERASGMVVGDDPPSLTDSLSPVSGTDELRLLQEAYLRRHGQNCLFVHPIKEGDPATVKTRATFVRFAKVDGESSAADPVAIVDVDDGQQAVRTKLALKYLKVPAVPHRLSSGCTDRFYESLASRSERTPVLFPSESNRRGFRLAMSLEELSELLVSRNTAGDMVFALGSDFFMLVSVWAHLARTHRSGFWGGSGDTQVTFALPVPFCLDRERHSILELCGVPHTGLDALCVVTQWTVQDLEGREPTADPLDDALFVGMLDSGPVIGPLRLFREYLEAVLIGYATRPAPDKIGRCARELLQNMGQPKTFVGN